MSATGTHDILPAPAANRAGDFVFVSSIYPVDASGRAIQSESSSPYTGESLVGAQSRAALGRLAAVLDEAGSSMDRLARVEVHLAAAEDFYEFKLAWKEVFPDDPPARTTVVVGDEHIVPGCRLNLHATALAGDSAWQREVISVGDVPDPMPAEHVPHAIKAGPFVFPSAVPATDFETGIPVGRKERMPYYGSDAEMQARYMFDNLQKVLKAAGSDIDQAVKSQLYEVDLSTFHDVDGIWAQYFGVPPTRSSMAVRDLLVPGAAFVANLTFLAPTEGYVKEETRKGMRWHPVDIRKVNFTPGINVGEWLFTAGQVSVPDYEKGIYVEAPPGLPHYYSDIEIQTEFTMEMLTEQLEANGCSLADISDARIFLVYPQRDYRGFERAWRKIFEPVGRFPAMSLIPSNQRNGGGGIMMEGLNIEIDLISRRS